GQLLIDSGIKSGCFSPRVPFVIDSVLTGKSAQLAGVQKGDTIVGINSLYSIFFQDVARELKKKPGEVVRLHVLRGGNTLTLAVGVSKEGTIGVQHAPMS